MSSAPPHRALWTCCSPTATISSATARWTVRANKSDWRSLNVGVDRSPPVARLRRADPATPRRVIADVSDVLSGIDRVALQYRSAAESDWRQLGEPVVTGQDGADATTVIADLPDRELPDGTYLLRVVATDRIGNRAIVRHPRRRVPSRRSTCRLGRDRRSTFGVLQKGEVPGASVDAESARIPVLLRYVISVGAEICPS